jgi:hypothetical protein
MVGIVSTSSSSRVPHRDQVRFLDWQRQQPGINAAGADFVDRSVAVGRSADVELRVDALRCFSSGGTT